MKSIENEREFHLFVKFMSAEINDAYLRKNYVSEIEELVDYKHGNQRQIPDNLIRFFDIVASDFYYRIVSIVFNILVEEKQKNSKTKKETDIKVDAIFEYYKDYPNKEKIVFDNSLMDKAMNELNLLREKEKDNIETLRVFKNKMISHITINQQSIKFDLVEGVLDKTRNLVDLIYGAVYGTGEQHLSLKNFQIGHYLKTLKENNK